MREKIKRPLILALVTVSMLFMGCSSLSKNTVSNDKLKNMKIINEDDILELDLYFDSGNGSIEKEESFIDVDEVFARTLVNCLIAGPSTKASSLKSILPKSTRLLSLSVKDGTAVVNLSSDAAVEMTKDKESACIKGLVSTLCQLDTIDKVKILIENNERETLGGNYSIIDAIGANDKLMELNAK